MNRKTIFGVIALVVFTTVLFMNFGEQVGGYMNFTEAEATGNSAHVVGKWVEDAPVAYNRDTNVFSFTMSDDQGNVRQVRYSNPKPANFEDAEQLVIEGYSAGDHFVAENILVKCPSKYNAAGEEMQPTAGR